MRLNNWSIGRGLYQAPEQGSYLVGEVYGHPTRPDGQCIQTSVVVSVDPTTETVKTHSGSIYEIGEPYPDFEEAFPDARERLLHCGLSEEVNDE